MTLFDMLLKKMKIHNSMLYEFAVDYIKVIRNCSLLLSAEAVQALLQSFLNALQQALRSENLADLMPETNLRLLSTQ